MLQVNRLWTAVAAAALFAAACSNAPASSGVGQPGPSPTAAAATPVAGAPTQPAASASAAVASPTPSVPPAGGGTAGGAGDPNRGKASFLSAGCVSCHGDRAQGNVFPGAAKLSGWDRPCGDILKQVRTPKDPSKGMPPFAATLINDAAVNDVCAWVKTNP